MLKSRTYRLFFAFGGALKCPEYTKDCRKINNLYANNIHDIFFVYYLDLCNNVSYSFVLFQAPAPNTRRTRARPTTSMRRPRTPVTVTTPPAPAVFSVGISRKFLRIRQSRPYAVYYYIKILIRLIHGATHTLDYIVMQVSPNTERF